MQSKLGFAEALSMILIITFSHLILVLPKLVLQSQGSSSIINIIYVTILTLISVFFFNLLYKKFNGQDILDVSNFIFGKWFKIIVGLIFIAYILFISSLLLRNTAENLRTMYFQSTPIPYIIFFFLSGAAFINKYSFKIVIKCNLMITALIMFSFIVLFLLSYDHFVFERIFPIAGYGFNTTFISGASNVSIFGNLIILLFLMTLLKNTKQFKKISYLSVVLSAIFTLLTITSLLLMFPISISSASNLPLHLQTRTITIGKFVQRVDALFIIIWIFSILSYISIVIGLLKYIFAKIFSIEDNYRIAYTFVGILFGISLIYSNILQVRRLDTQEYRILPLIIPLSLSFIILIIGNVKKGLQKKKGETLIE